MSEGFKEVGPNKCRNNTSLKMGFVQFIKPLIMDLFCQKNPQELKRSRWNMTQYPRMTNVTCASFSSFRMEIKHFYGSTCITRDIFEWIEAKFLSYSSHRR